MARIEFELKDSNGIDTDIGDIVIVHFPELSFSGAAYGISDYYRPEFTASAKILMPPSKGLTLRIIEIIDSYEDYADEYFKPGQRVAFKRTAWKWYRLDAPPK